MPIYRRPQRQPERGTITVESALLSRCAETKRPTLKGNYEEPRVPFRERMRWAAKVRRQVAAVRLEKRSVPHKIIAVADILAHIGDVCRVSFETIAARSGCCVKTAQACVTWLENNGCLTWCRTARRHTYGYIVRSANLYMLISDFRNLVTMIVRSRRPVWRERSKAFPDGNGCHGMTKSDLYISETERHEAQKRLKEARDLMAQRAKGEWAARFKLA